MLHDASLREIASQRPRTIESLAQVPGIGATKLERYGAAILAIVRAQVALDSCPAGSTIGGSEDRDALR